MWKPGGLGAFEGPGHEQGQLGMAHVHMTNIEELRVNRSVLAKRPRIKERTRTSYHVWQVQDEPEPPTIPCFCHTFGTITIIIRRFHVSCFEFPRIFISCA